MMQDLDTDRKLVSIHEAARFLEVTPTTLRRWEREGRALTGCTDSRRGSALCLNRLGAESQGLDHPDRKTVAYARVSSHEQKDDLERQKQVLELYCARQGWTFEVVDE